MKTIISELDSMKSKLKDLGLNDTTKLKELIDRYRQLGREHNLSGSEYNADYVENEKYKMLLLRASKDRKWERFKETIGEFDSILNNQIRQLKNT
jgi:hypothetical protein